MAAKRKYPTPREQLLELALSAKERRLSFGAFWEEAVRPGKPPVTRRHPNPPPSCVIWPSDTADRNAERQGTLGAREGWRRAYEGEPALPREEALPVLSTFMEHFADTSEETVLRTAA